MEIERKRRDSGLTFEAKESSNAFTMSPEDKGHAPLDLVVAYTCLFHARTLPDGLFKYLEELNWLF